MGRSELSSSGVGAFELLHAEDADEAGGLRGGDEVLGVNHAEAGVGPAGQCLEPHDDTGVQVDDGLEVDPDPVGDHSVVQRELKLEARTP